VSLPTCRGTGRKEGGSPRRCDRGKIRGRTAVRAQDDVVLVVQVLCDVSLPFFVLRQRDRVHLPAPRGLLTPYSTAPPWRQVTTHSTGKGMQRGFLRHSALTAQAAGPSSLCWSCWFDTLHGCFDSSPQYTGRATSCASNRLISKAVRRRTPSSSSCCLLCRGLPHC